MEITTIITSKKDVTVKCPYCDNWETTGIDDPRHRFELLPVLDWIGEDEDGNELSRNGCDCGKEFIVVWNYNNNNLNERDEEDHKEHGDNTRQ